MEELEDESKEGKISGGMCTGVCREAKGRRVEEGIQGVEEESKERKRKETRKGNMK